MALRTISICAGVGGLDLGVRIARPDAVCVCFVERETSAAASLVASMEAGRLHPAPVWSDLATFDAGSWRGAVDCVLSGDPCQGNSVAGKRLGELDERWLLDRAIEVFDQSGAYTFFRENVTGNAAGQIAVAIPALERLGCRVAVGIFSAAEAGASHRRERLFILAQRGLANANGCRCGREGDRSIASERADQSSGQLGIAHGAHLKGGGQRSDASGWQEPNGHAGLAGGGLAAVRSTILFAPGPSDPRWPDIIATAPALEPAVCRMADGMANRIERLRHCGNGVVPLTAALAWVRLHGLLADDAAGGAGDAAGDATCPAAAAVRAA